MESPNIMTFDAKNSLQFWWKKRLFWEWFQLIKFERIDDVPDIEDLKRRFWLKHAWIIWIPNGKEDIPKWWKRFLIQTHFIYANVTYVTQEYYKKWNQRAQRARKKFLSSGVEIKQVSSDELIEAFRKTPVRHLFKKDYIEYYQKMAQVDETSLRSYVAYYKWFPIAGLGVHDYHKSSVHLIAFTNKKMYKLQAGTGLIDRWFLDSYTNGVSYIDFDRLREPLGPKDQQGYTDFKNNFIEFTTRFDRSYFKIF